MNLNQHIEKALGDIVDGNIWPMVCPLEDKPTEFITYDHEDHSDDFGDNEEEAWVYEVEVNWYKLGAGSRTKQVALKPANFIQARERIRTALKAAGFIVSKILYNHESDTGYTHLTFLAEIEEEDYED